MTNYQDCFFSSFFLLFEMNFAAESSNLDYLTLVVVCTTESNRKFNFRLNRFPIE